MPSNSPISVSVHRWNVGTIISMNANMNMKYFEYLNL
jgi:hypothetical protein